MGRGLLMHEYSLIQALLDRVEDEARLRGAVAVNRISVRIGEMAGVERGLFWTAFEMCREGTICKRADLVISPVEARWACRLCGREVTQGEVLCCERCGAPARLLSGDEIVLDQIEMEVA
ncbi:MAG TPA: hydrogenase maturation nickel metallochaperone HypA [Blastocatellia bacterium]|nr:hydrogenase maturation nickel metallochaperone HypA [Blastocatellia bacterium]